MSAATELPKVAPHSNEAEQSVLGAILLDDAALAKVRNIVKPEDFYRTAHTLIYRAMIDLAQVGQPIDLITLSEAMRNTGVLENAGGSAYLAELINIVPSSANVSHHAGIVAEKAQLRMLRTGLMSITEAINEGMDLERVSLLIQTTSNSFQAYRPGGLPESNFNPPSASELLAEVPEPTVWIVEDYIAEACLALFAGKPKEGKTTLAYGMAVNVAQGRLFLGRKTRKSGVLILAVEEHSRDVKDRLRALGAEDLDNLYVRVGGLSPSPTLFSDLCRFITERQIRLVIIDTLAAFWNVENENDASEMTQAVKPLLNLARESGACVLLIHHARKSEGSHGDEIRGSGALFGLVDVALIMKRHTVETQRLLQAQSRYPETPAQLILELRESGYVALGDPAEVGKADKLRRLREVLTDHPQEIKTLAKQAGLSLRDATRLLERLLEAGEALREGVGRKGDPYRFLKFDSGRGPGLKARNEFSSTDGKTDSIQAGPTTFVPPARNESEDVYEEEPTDAT